MHENQNQSSICSAGVDIGWTNKVRTGVTKIPVVIHVVWKTQSQNISEDQILSQFHVLNRDFRMLNDDIIQVPAVWNSLVS